EVVFRQGDPGDMMFVVYSGKVRVLRETDGGELPLNTLFAGEHFGELALVSHEPRNATIRAAADSTLVGIPAEAVRALLDRNEDLQHYFDRYAERLELWNFIKLVGQLGGQLKPPQLRQVVDRFEIEDIAASTEILAAGSVPDRFRLVQKGRVNVLEGGRCRATLTSGDTFGGGALVERPPAASRLAFHADGPVRLLTLSAAAFCELVDGAPTVRQFFAERAAHTRADEAAEHFAEISARVRADQVADPLARPAAPVTTAVDGVDLVDRAERQAAVELAAAPPATSLGETTRPSLPPAPAMGAWRRWCFPFIPQHEEVDCGAASLAMIAAHHGRPVGVSRLRDLAGVTTTGASLTQLIYAAEEIGYTARGLRVSADRLGALRLPATLFWRGQHYVVLYALTSRYAYIADPAIGKRRLRLDALAQNYSGIALEVLPTGAIEKIRAKRPAARRLVELLAKNKRTLAAILASSLLLDLCGLVPAVLTQRIVDAVVPSGNLSLLNLVALAMVLVAVLQIGMTAARSLLAVRLSQRLDRALLGEFYAHLLALPTRFFKLRRTGDIVARFGDNQNVRDLFTAGTLTAVLDSFMVVVYFAVMFSWNVPLALVVLAFVPLFVGFTLAVSPIMKRMHRRLLEEQAAHESNLIETIGGIDMVKAMAIEEPIRRKWEKLFQQFLATQLQSQRLEQAFSAVGSAIGVLSNVALIWFGAWLVLRQKLSIGEFMAFNMLANQVNGPLARVVGLWDQLQQARVSLERMSDVLDTDPEPQAPVDQRVYPTRVRGRVKFDRVFFRYSTKGAPYVLRNVSFEAEPGQRIAVVGRSGSGKTTLVRLLLGLYRPTEGHIFVDDHDLGRIDLSSYRRHVGFVLQENTLFAGTIVDNIALGDLEPDRQRAEEAAVLAGAHEFIGSMPLAYDTVVGEFGLTLSGGQRQRINIARALYRNPQILVLDEATSALDSLSEREIQKNLDAILADRTAFVIAHKIATVREADMILVLHDGTIVERGTHNQLMARRGTYYYLAAQQLNL
ncbi:MAG: ABC transporter transmembrane domain-containing protein, partial [Pirellulales bacterium]